MALSASANPVWEQTGAEVFEDCPVASATTLYEGGAIGDSSGTAVAISADTYVFIGFAERGVVNASGGSNTVRLRAKGHIQLAVTGVASTDDIGVTVYATADDAFTTTSTSATSIGKVSRWVSGTTCIVAFESAAERSL